MYINFEPDIGLNQHVGKLIRIIPVYSFGSWFYPNEIVSISKRVYFHRSQILLLLGYKRRTKTPHNSIIIKVIVNNKILFLLCSTMFVKYIEIIQ